MPEFNINAEFGPKGEPVVYGPNFGGIFQPGYFNEPIRETQGDGNANGTAIYTKQIDPTKIAVITDIIIACEVTDTLFRFVASDTNGVGGVEDVLMELWVPAGLNQIPPVNRPKFMIRNTSTSSPIYLVIYAPATAAGAANNANTEYWSGNVRGYIY